MSDKHNNSISVFVYISILINIIVLALFITFVFGLKKDAFDVDTKKLDRNALICQNSIVSLVQDYDARLNKIVESYPFINLLQQVILNGIDENEKERIISIFRSGNYPFDTVALYLADGKPVFSSPVKTKPVDLESYKKSEAKAFFDKDYDGVYFVKPIRNDRGIEVGYIVASVFKKIFENTSYNLNFVVLPNGVVYYNSSIDINSISRDSLTQYMNKEVGSSETIEVDNNTFTFYSSKVKDIDNSELKSYIKNKYLVNDFTDVVIVQRGSQLFEELITSPEFISFLKDNYLKILHNEFKDNAIQLNFNKTKSLNLTIGKSMIYNPKFDKLGNFSSLVVDFYDFDKMIINKNSDLFTKLIAPINNNAYIQQQSGKLTNYILIIPILLFLKDYL